MFFKISLMKRQIMQFDKFAQKLPSVVYNLTLNTQVDFIKIQIKAKQCMQATTKPTNIFTYGTLMYPEVMYGLVKKKDYHTQPVLLKGYTRKQVKFGRTYPGLKKEQGKQVNGVLYLNVQPSDVQILHNFEGSEYVPHTVTVEAKDGTKIEAVAYLYANPGNLEHKEWDLAYFQKNHKADFAFTHVCPSD